MTETPMQKTTHKLAKIYAGGLLTFTAVVGFITALASFLAHLA
jgi:hypothetical protein